MTKMHIRITKNNKLKWKLKNKSAFKILIKMINNTKITPQGVHWNQKTLLNKSSDSKKLLTILRALSIFLSLNWESKAVTMAGVIAQESGHLSSTAGDLHLCE